MHILSLAGVFPTTPANTVGTTHANNRMGYAQANVSPWTDIPIRFMWAVCESGSTAPRVFC